MVRHLTRGTRAGSTCGAYLICPSSYMDRNVGGRVGKNRRVCLRDNTIRGQSVNSVCVDSFKAAGNASSWSVYLARTCVRWSNTSQLGARDAAMLPTLARACGDCPVYRVQTPSCSSVTPPLPSFLPPSP